VLDIGHTDDFYGVSVAVDGDLMVVGALTDEPNGNITQGSAYLYQKTATGNWQLIKKFLARDGKAFDAFSRSVAISGTTVVVGAAWKDTPNSTSDGVDRGAVYVFERDQGGTNKWGLVKKLLASDGKSFDYFGYSVAISGDTIVVGALNGTNVDKGSAYIFSRNTGGTNAWGRVKELVVNDGVADDQFGKSISISGNTIVVGAFWDDVATNINQGSAYVFERDQSGINKWGLVKKLMASDGAASDAFGSSVSISGNTIVIGVDNHIVGTKGNLGAAYVFERNLGGVNNWGEVKELIASDSVDTDSFGSAVSIHDNTIVVGSFGVGGDQNIGAAYLFRRNLGGSNAWGQIRKLIASDRSQYDYLGISTSISSGTVLVGAFGQKNNIGAAYIFKN
jgi:FG-GAP repeat